MLNLADDVNHVPMRQLHHQLDLFLEVVLVLLEHFRFDCAAAARLDRLDGHLLLRAVKVLVDAQVHSAVVTLQCT